MERIYIAGPMTSYINFNFEAFDHMRDHLHAQNIIPVSPADLDRAIGFDPARPEAHHAILEADRSAFMRSAVIRDVAALADCTGIVMLNGWGQSKGARAELAVAEWLGLSVYYENQFCSAYLCETRPKGLKPAA